MKKIIGITEEKERKKEMHIKIICGRFNLSNNHKECSIYMNIHNTASFGRTHDQSCLFANTQKKCSHTKRLTET